MIKAFAILLVLLSVTAEGQSPDPLIKSKMKELRGMIGTWDVETKMISTNGKVVDEKGTYEIKWALDSTYLLLEGDLRSSASGRIRKFVCWTTFDKSKERYRNIYLYSGTSFSVEETGAFDADSKKLRTTATLSLGDGRTELLRTELEIKTKDLMIFNSWSRFGEEKEFNDFQAIIRRGS